MRKRSIYTDGKGNWTQLYDTKLFVGLLKIATEFYLSTPVSHANKTDRHDIAFVFLFGSPPQAFYFKDSRFLY